MRSSRVFCAVLAFVALLIMSCGDSADDIGEGRYLILGNMGNTAFSDGSVQVTITQLADNVAGADEATVTINGFDIPVVIGSNELVATYLLNHFGYTPGTSYTIRVNIDGDEAVCNVTTPGATGITIIAPEDDSRYTPGEQIRVEWICEGGSFNGVHFIADDEHSGDSDSTWDYEETFPGTITEHTIPASVTSGFTGEVWISVDPGEEFFDFDGGGSSLGSGMTIVLAADWISLFASSTTEVADILLDFNVSSLPADGASSTTISATVIDSYGISVGDGVPVTFSTTIGVIDPETAYTWGGVATATLYSGSVAGTAQIRATSGTVSETSNFEITPVVSLVVFVGAGQYPQINWTPSSQLVKGLNVGQIGAVTPKWSVISIAGMTSPVTYGTTPVNAEQLIPIMGGTPDALTTGTEYRITLIAENDDTTFYTFTR